MYRWCMLLLIHFFMVIKTVKKKSGKDGRNYHVSSQWRAIKLVLLQPMHATGDRGMQTHLFILFMFNDYGHHFVDVIFEFASRLTNIDEISRRFCMLVSKN